jgi:nitrogenase subunit NifH
MYNIYSEEKKLLEIDKKINQEKDTIINNERHKQRTNNLVNKYQKRIKKFIIDVSAIKYIISFII